MSAVVAPPAAPDCPVCGSALTGAGVAGATPVYCERCGTPHHADCFTYNERCAVYGCAGTTPTVLPLALDTLPLVIAEEPGETHRLFIPIAPAGGAGQLTRERVLLIGGLTGALACAPFQPALSAALVLFVAVQHRNLRRQRLHAAWEVDGTARELARVVRARSGVRRVVFEKLDRVRAAVVRRTDVSSTTQRDGTGWYRSAWLLELRWAGRTRELTAPEWTDGHAEPPLRLLEMGRRLARVIERPLELDPPAEGKLPPGLGTLPSHSS